MFAEEIIFCIWLSCAYKQSHFLKKKKKASSPHSRFSPLLQVVLKRMLPLGSGNRQGKGTGRKSPCMLLPLQQVPTASCRHHCSPKGIFLRSRLTILVHNWIIFLFFETTVCVPDLVKCTGVRHTEYFIEMNSSVCSLRETALRYPNIILMMDCKVIFPASSVN